MTTTIPALSPSSATTTVARLLTPPTFCASTFVRRPLLTFTTGCSSKKQEASFTDRILDYIEGGPKLRKWYGAPELRPVDGGSYDSQEDASLPEQEEARDAVFVTNGDSEIGQSSAYGGSSGLQALLNRRLKTLAERDEAAVIASGIPYTIVMAGMLQDSPGGTKGFDFKVGVASKGKLSREDAARICVESLDVVPQKGIVLEVANGEEKVSDWKEVLASRIKDEEQLQ